MRKNLLLKIMTVAIAIAFLPVRAAEPSELRMRFLISAAEVDGGQRDELYEAAIEGPPGTDFEVTLKGTRFRMTASFRTDLTGPSELRMRARLDTRRLYGYSERGLPLYEEDRRHHDLRMRLDEDLMLLPFGGIGEDPRLEILIRPTMLQEPGPPKLDIDILRPTRDGSVSVRAYRVPHHFETRVTLLADGAPVASAKVACLLEEEQAIHLEPLDAAAAVPPLRLDLTVSRFVRGRPLDSTVIEFDITEGEDRIVGRDWAGQSSLGSALNYDLTDLIDADSGRNYELRIEVRQTQPPYVTSR